MDIYFIDNTDPDGILRALNRVPDIAKTLCIIISKSGGTKETRNGQLAARRFLEERGVNYSKHFVAVTCEGSALDQQAKGEGWLARFPMWDWVGGRTSQLSTVGLLPAALQGFDIDALLAGAKKMDALTRRRDTLANPAAMLAVAWYSAGGGKGDKNMVVLPYKDRLELFGRYLQQLVMESIGKERAIDGSTVTQGLTVYGNKGSTDQHAFVQQLREGRNDFFAVLIEVLKDCPSLKQQTYGSAPDCVTALEVEPGITSGDYLFGFLQGTRQALADNGRESITITLREVSAGAVGMLIALFERTVGLYATLVGVNAYHQPGVEAGKRAAGQVLVRQAQILECLAQHQAAVTVEHLADSLGTPDEKVLLFKILEHLSATGRVQCISGPTPFEARYQVV
jgi:glucose-6-phosphate isomerase